MVLLEDRSTPAVVVFQINRPEAKNALNEAVRLALVQAFDAFIADPDVHCAVITGGPIFAAGADIRDLVERGAAEMLQLASRPGAATLWNTLSRCPKPIIAAVNGYAWGGGCELAMHADVIFASEGASFCQPEIKLGIMPGGGGTQRLIRAVGKYQAMKILLSGKPVSAREACSIGLVSEVIDKNDCLPAAVEFAKTVAAMPQVAVKQIKEVVIAGQDMALDAALRLERKAFQLLFDTHDQKEGMRAFIEKRPPAYRGS